MNTRLQQFLAAENLTQAQFADSIGVARAGVSHIISGRNNPGYDFILSVMKRYPDLNVEWLLSGKGKMYKSTPTPLPSTPDDSVGGLFAEIPEPQMPPATPRESDIPRPVVQEIASVETTEGIQPPAEIPQQLETQRKVTKIILLYDDGSFQEF